MSSTQISNIPPVNIAKGDKEMKYQIEITGMMCANCKAHVEKALNALAGVTAVVNLEENNAVATSSRAVSNEELTKAVTEAGYTVTEIKEL